MENPQISIRFDLANGSHIGPGKIALLEAIRAEGSITAAARQLGMSYRRAWPFGRTDETMVLQHPAVVKSIGAY